MGSMDMTGFRMIPSGQSLMMPTSEPWKRELIKDMATAFGQVPYPNQADVICST